MLNQMAIVEWYRNGSRHVEIDMELEFDEYFEGVVSKGTNHKDTIEMTIRGTTYVLLPIMNMPEAAAARYLKLHDESSRVFFDRNPNGVEIK